MSKGLRAYSACIGYQGLCPNVLSGVAKMAWDVMSGVTKTAWDVMSGVTKTAWDVLSGVANLCGMFCPGCQKMAWDVLSRDVLSGSLSQGTLYFS